MSKNLSESAQRRKGIFLLCIPVLVIPVLGLLAWNSPADSLSTQPDSRGLNLEIPGPALEKNKAPKQMPINPHSGLKSNRRNGLFLIF